MLAQPRHAYRYRSLFWLAVLITLGLVWVFYNLGVISGGELVLLLRLWPCC